MFSHFNCVYLIRRLEALSPVLTLSNVVPDRQLVPNRIYLKWYMSYFYCFVPIIYIQRPSSL